MHKKNKIIITSPFVENGGVAQFISNLKPYFHESVRVFKRGKRNNSSLFNFILPVFDIIRFLIILLRYRPVKVLVNSSLSFVGIFRDGAFVWLSKIFGIKTVLFIHGFEKNALKNNKKPIQKGYFKADAIFVLASSFKDILFDLGYHRPIQVSSNPINHELLENKKFLIKKNANVPIKILMMSRIEKSKGILIGLEAFKLLNNQDLELHIAGNGSALETAKNYVLKEKMNHVFFHGFISGQAKEELMRSCDILLFPTFHNEGLPINILESLAMGLFIISRPIAGINDLAEKYSLHLTDSLLPSDFAKEIGKILSAGLPERELIRNQELAQVDFSPQLIYKKVMDGFEADRQE